MTPASWCSAAYIGASQSHPWTILLQEPARRPFDERRARTRNSSGEEERIGKCGPDGVRSDIDGNLWVSSNGNPGGRGLGYSGVTVWTPEGKLIGRIRLPEVCANICFGGPKRNRLFMVASQSLYALYVNTQGAAPG